MEQLDIKGLGLREEPELSKIIGSSKEIKEVIKGIQTVLESDVPVVIQGETETGSIRNRMVRGVESDAVPFNHEISARDSELPTSRYTFPASRPRMQ